MTALEGELLESRYGAATRLETAHDCPEELAAYLLEHFRLTRSDLYQVPGPVNLNRLLGRLRPRGSTRAEVRAVHARRAEAAGESEHLRGDLEARHSAAPPVRVVRAGHRFRVSRRDRSRRAGDQANALPNDAGLAAGREPRLSRKGRQGSHGADRAARAVRRSSEHRAREQASGGRRPRRLRRRRFQDPLQDDAGRASRGQPSSSATCTWGRATIIREPRAPTPTTDCFRPTRLSARTSTRCSCSSRA